MTTKTTALAALQSIENRAKWPGNPDNSIILANQTDLARAIGFLVERTLDTRYPGEVKS